MNLSADFILMTVTYIVATVVFMYLAVKYAKTESLHPPERESGRRSSSVPRVTFLGKTTWVVLKNPLTLVIMTTVILTSLISGYAASSRTSYVAFNVESGHEFMQAVFIEFSHAIPKDIAEKSIYSLTRELNESEARLAWYARHVLDSPIKLRYGDYTHMIYVLLGLSTDELKRLLNISVQEGAHELLYAGISPTNEVNATVIAARGKVFNVTVKGIPGSALARAEIIPGVPLLPVQSYIGTKPVTPPPKYVLVGDIDAVNPLINVSRDTITDVLIVSGARSFGLHTLTQLARSADISRVWFLNGRKLYVISTVQIPTTKSMVVALLSSATATVLCLAVASALLPSLKNLYLRLSIQGMPPWGASIINTAYTMLVALVPGIIVVLYSYHYLGGVSAFNSLISAVITWALMFTYLSLKSKPPKLRTDVYSPPSQRYVIFLGRKEITEVVQEISKSLQGNEFFELLEFESRAQGNEAVIHARLAYIESWGVGADMSILVTNTDEGTYVNISCIIWSIEEVSEAIMNNVLALLLSRVVGRLKSWELSQY